MRPRRLLIVDPNHDSAAGLAALVRRHGWETYEAKSGSEALALLVQHGIPYVISEWALPDMNGTQLIAAIRNRSTEVAVAFAAEEASVTGAVEAMRVGAQDYLEKPVRAADLERALYRLAAGQEPARQERRSAPRQEEQPMIGESAALRACVELIDKAARGPATVLLRGESGTGKELAAREIHRLSEQARGAFVKAHCAALPDTLLESELFGYERGAFSGASARKLGRVDLARGGTLFLDEIGDVPPVIQVKLLRLLQDREYERLGGTETLQADVRFVAATNRDLESMVADGTFRQDLFYRLNVVPLWLPPLRDRADDIELLADHFCRALRNANHMPALVFEEGALELFRHHTWPGNVRQLQNVVERLVVLSDGQTIRIADVTTELSRLSDVEALDVTPQPASSGQSLERLRRDAEREALLEALQTARYNRTFAAQLLGVSRRTLYNRLQAHGLLEQTSPRSSPPPPRRTATVPPKRGE